MEKKSEEWSGIEHVTLLFGYITSLMREGKENDNHSLFDPPNFLEVQKIRALSIIRPPPPKLLLNMDHLSLVTSLVAAPFIVIISNIPLISQLIKFKENVKL